MIILYRIAVDFFLLLYHLHNSTVSTLYYCYPWHEPKEICNKLPPNVIHHGAQLWGHGKWQPI